MSVFEFYLAAPSSGGSAQRSNRGATDEQAEQPVNAPTDAAPTDKPARRVRVKPVGSSSSSDAAPGPTAKSAPAVVRLPKTLPPLYLDEDPE